MAIYPALFLTIFGAVLIIFRNRLEKMFYTHGSGMFPQLNSSASFLLVGIIALTVGLITIFL